MQTAGQLRWIPDANYPDGTVWDLYRGQAHLGWVWREKGEITFGAQTSLGKQLDYWFNMRRAACDLLRNEAWS